MWVLDQGIDHGGTFKSTNKGPENAIAGHSDRSSSCLRVDPPHVSSLPLLPANSSEVAVD